MKEKAFSSKKISHERSAASTCVHMIFFVYHLKEKITMHRHIGIQTHGKFWKNIQDTIEGDHFFRNRTRGAGVEENPFFMVCALFFLSPHVCFFHTNKKSQITHKGEPRFPVNNLGLGVGEFSPRTPKGQMSSRGR